MYVYRRVPDGPGHYLYTVGFFHPDGTWEPESDWETRDEAALRVRFLNGGND